MAVDLYRKLQQHLDRMPVGFPPTESGVELRILKQLFTVEEVRVALEMSAVPEKLEVIQRRIRPPMETGKLRRTLEAMSAKGTIEVRGAGRERRFGKAAFVVGIYERQVDRLTPELERDTRQYLDEAFAREIHSGRTSQMRTVPIHKSIIPEHNVAIYESMLEFAAGHDGPFAVMNCVCRQGKDLVGEPCKLGPVRETCITIGPAARSMVERGVARFIGSEEVLDLLDQAEREGMVIQPQNTRDPLFICCCCGCCCGVLTTAKKFDRPAEFFASNYYSEVDRDLCAACGVCETRCQMDAISAGDDGYSTVNRDRCIGCGLCVSTCETGAMQLRRRESETVPPKDTSALYMKILRERFGTLGTAKIMGRRMLGLKI